MHPNTFRCPPPAVGHSVTLAVKTRAHKENPLPPRGLRGERGQGRVANAAAEPLYRRRRYRRQPPTPRIAASRNCAMIGRVGTAASRR